MQWLTSVHRETNAVQIHAHHLVLLVIEHDTEDVLAERWRSNDVYV